MSFRRWLYDLFSSRKTVTSRRRGHPCDFETLEDRRVPATLTVTDTTLIEGNAGTTNALVTVKLSSAANPNVSVNYRTANGSAAAGSDYQSVSGTLTFNKGQTSKTILVPIIGDSNPESNETFFFNLSN